MNLFKFPWPCLTFRITLRCHFVKKLTQLSHAMVKTISSRSSSGVLEQVDDQGMREGKGIHTIRDP